MNKEKNNTLPQALRNALEKNGSAILLSHNKRNLSGNEIQSLINGWIKFLQNSSCRHNNFIAIHSDKSMDEWLIIVSLLISETCGLSIPAESIRFSEELLEQYPIDFILVHDKYAPLYQNLPAIGSYENFTIFKNVKADSNLQKLPEICKWTLLTSGSTGKSKLVMISQENLYQRAFSEVQYFGLTVDDKILNFLNVSHDLGLNQLLSCLLAGAKLVLHKYIFPQDLFNLIQECRISGFTAVPSFWRTLLPYESQFGVFLSGLRYVTVSGGSLTPNELIKIRKALPNVIIIKTYGQTETFRSLIKCYQRGDFNLGDDLGDPVIGTHLSLISDINGGHELVHSGLGTMLGYYPTLEPTPARILTGDLFELTSTGAYRYVSRKDQMKKINGYRFYPALIESKALAIHGVLEAAVLLKINSDGKEFIQLFLVVDASTQKDKIIPLLKSQLPKVFIPEQIYFLDSMPVTNSGKIDYQNLTRLFA